MLAYQSARRSAERRSAPHAMLFIVAGHIAVIAAVMSAKMDIPQRIIDSTKVELIPLPEDPPRELPPPPPRAEPQPSQSTIDRVPVIVPVPQPGLSPTDDRPVPIPSDPVIGPRVDPIPIPSVPAVAPVRVGPRFATPASALRPPYPASKLNAEEEAVLKLRLSIDARGRVIAVDPVGPADPAFLQAARRHLTARWRYQPATEDGRPVASSTVITLRFELDG